MYNVGDWVVEKSNGEVKQVTCGASENMLARVKMYERLCVRWKPKINEWCWFISVHDAYELLKFAGMLSNGKYTAQTLHGGIYNYSKCEPFIGEIPSSLKEKL